jgi:ribokinase
VNEPSADDGVQTASDKAAARIVVENGRRTASSTTARDARATLACVPVELTVVGSINLDLVAQVERLPRPGETVGGAQLARYPGGKGANQAVAAARLGARVRMLGAVGEDAFAAEALAGLEEAGVELELECAGETGVALIFVDSTGENEIVTVSGANALVTPRTVEGPVLCQLEVPDEVVLAAASAASFVALNAAPARRIDLDPDLLVVNRLEREVVSRGRLVAVTFGAEGAALYENGQEVARAAPPPVTAVDGTAAGDAFTACLTVSLLEGRPRAEALARACAAGALAASRPGAQPSLPTLGEVEAILAR